MRVLAEHVEEEGVQGRRVGGRECREEGGGRRVEGRRRSRSRMGVKECQ